MAASVLVFGSSRRDTCGRISGSSLQTTAMIPWFGAGTNISGGSRFPGTSSDRRCRPASARTIASYCLSESFRRRVSTFPLRSRTETPGKFRRICALRLGTRGSDLPDLSWRDPVCKVIGWRVALQHSTGYHTFRACRRDILHAVDCDINPARQNRVVKCPHEDALPANLVEGKVGDGVTFGGDDHPFCFNSCLTEVMHAPVQPGQGQGRFPVSRSGEACPVPRGDQVGLLFPVCCGEEVRLEL